MADEPRNPAILAAQARTTQAMLEARKKSVKLPRRETANMPTERKRV